MHACPQYLHMVLFIYYVVLTVESVVEIEELVEGRSSQLYTPLVQLRKESLKRIQACTGFEPLTSAIPVQRSTN